MIALDYRTSPGGYHAAYALTSSPTREMKFRWIRQGCVISLVPLVAQNAAFALRFRCVRVYDAAFAVRFRCFRVDAAFALHFRCARV